MTSEDFNLEIAARTVWCEARGEGVAGISAVAWAIVNRAKSRNWYAGKTLADCCLYPLQFSSWNAKDPNRRLAMQLAAEDPLLGTCRAAVSAALAGTVPDPVAGATHYFAVTMLDAPDWARSPGGIFCGQIGKHRFYRNIP